MSCFTNRTPCFVDGMMLLQPSQIMQGIVVSNFVSRFPQVWCFFNESLQSEQTRVYKRNFRLKLPQTAWLNLAFSFSGGMDWPAAGNFRAKKNRTSKLLARHRKLRGGLSVAQAGFLERSIWLSSIRRWPSSCDGRPHQPRPGPGRPERSKRVRERWGLVGPTGWPSQKSSRCRLESG